MGVRRPNAPWVITRQVTLSADNAKDSKVGTVSAPDVNGYDFVCWVYVVPAGYVGTPYISESTLQSDVIVWDGAIANSTWNNKFVRCTALYQRTSD